MATAADSGRAPTDRPSPRGALARSEDWWAVLIGLALTLAAVLLFSSGDSLKGLAFAPQKWAQPADILVLLSANAARIGFLFAVLAASFGVAVTSLGARWPAFLQGFTAVFIVALVIYCLGLWDQAARYNLEPPLVALALGLVVANTVGTPAWVESSLRVELFIKTGIVLLGASLPLTLVVWAGSIAIVQASIVSVVTFLVIYAIGTRLGLDRRFAATLGTGGAVCGVSGAIAVGGAVGARREDVSVAISLVILWAILAIFALPLAARTLMLPTAVAGAWIGTSELADAAGLAAAQAYGGYAGHVPGISGSPESAVNAFTLMKVIGRDLWIGVWAFVLSLIATTRWERTGIETGPRASQIWQRLPKFIIGFLLASVTVTVVARGLDFAAYRKLVVPALVAPLQILRIWAFTLAFLSIGLTTRIRDLTAGGIRPFLAISGGVVVNVILGYFLSTRVFGDFWTHFGQ